ncbi:CoA pyrophosphatase [Arthrobacter sp. Bz4]|uniref:NUDIX hydrolase n=1 Tax=Arthrobacter sp. Bz4 TaxID=2171979 RepID=UPI000D524596|nr:CoA pyrophosphatase [Arthrobacter sp. Bz4]PVE17414.1 coenzyme A pyrophosphatase [Arthrobacter sp. Bz4]
MSAREQLLDLAKRSVSQPGTLRGIDPAEARHAAVLILFGILDDRPAEFHAGAVPDDLDVLLVLRSGSLTDHPGQVAFPGGRIDDGDDGPVAAALREAWEETGVDTAGIEVLGPLPESGLPVSNFLVTPVLAWWADQSPVTVVDEAESEHVFRVPVADLLNPAGRRSVIGHRNGVTWTTPAFLVRDVTVWGFTALLLDALFDDLGWTLPWDKSDQIPPPL